MWKLFRQAARSRWFTSQQKRKPADVTGADPPSKAVSVQYNLFTRSIKPSEVPADTINSDNADSNKREESSYKDEYGFYNIHPSLLEAISWLGTSFALAVNLKLKLCNFHQNHFYQDQVQRKNNSNDSCLRHGLCTHFASLLPLAFSMPNSRKAVLSDASSNLLFNATNTTTDKKESKNSEPSSSFEKAYNKMKIASDEYTGHIENIIALRCLFQDPSEAFNHFKAAGKLGCSKANFNLGLCYEIGKGTKQDLTKAVHYYQLAASDGHTLAMYNLGIYYVDGLGGLEKDESKGLQLIEKAAVKGESEAQNFMGIHCLENEKWDKAFKYFQSAAKHNIAESHYYLGLCYENGWGVNISYSEAVKHFSSAASGGYLEAEDSLQCYLNKDSDKNHFKTKGQLHAPCIHSSSSSPELSCIGSTTQPHPLADFDLSNYLNRNIHLWQERNHLDSDIVLHSAKELPHWMSTPSLLAVT